MEASKSKKEVPAAAPQAAASPAAKKLPVKVVQVDDVSAPIFAHHHEVGGVARINYSWTVQRSYKDSSGQWRRTPWLSQDDFGKAVTAIQQASEWVHDAEQKAQ